MTEALNLLLIVIMSVIVVTVLFCENDYLSPWTGSIPSPLVMIIVLYPVLVVEFLGVILIHENCSFIHSLKYF